MRIRDRLSEAQDGQALAHLARAFRLPPTKVDPAVGAMTDALIDHIHAKMGSRHSLARLVELLGKGVHEQVLESPTLLGATSTQVAGNEALSVIAGRDASKTIAQQAASMSGVSEMIAEYLLPVIAAMLVGALASESREGLARLLRSDSEGDGAVAPQRDVAPVVTELPRVVAGGVGFSGSGGAVRVVNAAESSYHVELAERIRRGTGVPGTPDAAEATRRVLAPIMGPRSRPLGWLEHMHALSEALLKAMFGLRQH